MSKIYKAPFAQTLKHGTAVVTAANTALDGSGTIATLATFGAEGGRLEGLYAGCRATVTATAVRFFVSADGGSTWTYLPHLDSLIPAHTVANTTANAGRVTVVDRASPDDWIGFAANARLGCTIAVALAGGIVFEAWWGDY
jgi:hypothetical protein